MLNDLIRELNGGKLDKSFQINGTITELFIT